MFDFSLLLFGCSSTFKDAERASLRDSGHGDSDQADSDQDTNKGSHCDTSAKEALKMKAVAVNGQPFDKGEWTSSRCLTDSYTRHCLYLMQQERVRHSLEFKWKSTSFWEQSMQTLPSTLLESAAAASVAAAAEYFAHLYIANSLSCVSKTAWRHQIEG